MKISKKSVVKLKYSLFDQLGNLIDSSETNGSLIYIHGLGMMMPGIEKIIDGQEEGFIFSGEIEPEDGYGVYKQENVIPVPRAQFEHLIDKMEEGKLYNFDMDDGQTQLLKIVTISDDIITIDANHPYAGEKLKLECNVEGVRSATTQELESLKTTSDCRCGNHGDSGGCSGHGKAKAHSGCCGSHGADSNCACKL